MDIHLKQAADEIIEKVSSQNSNASGAKVLITGACGFLGAHFVHYFLRLNDLQRLDTPCTVFACDNLMRGRPNWLLKLQNRSDLKVLESDIIHTTTFPKVDFIIHAASIASPTYYRLHPIETMDANVIGLRNILEFAKILPQVKSILFFSSSEIYGDPSPDQIPTSEEYRGFVSCTGPRACYDESKRYGETLSVNFFQVHKVPIKIARPFNNYGPGLNLLDKRVIPDFFRDALFDRDITLLSDGSAKRTFCYVTDAIYGYLLLLFSHYNGESFNIGVDTPEISMHELGARILAITEKKHLKIIRKQSDDQNYLVDNPIRRCPNIEKAKRLLGYNPTVGLDEGLLKTYRYYLDEK